MEGPYTLAQLAKIETDPLRKGIIMNLLRWNSLLGVVPFQNVDSLTSVAVRAAHLPEVGFRKINEGYVPSVGDFEQVYESVYGFGGEIEFDRVFDKVGNVIVKPRVSQTQLKLRSIAATFNDYFINGDHGIDPDGFEGLKKRVTVHPPRQSVTPGLPSAAALDPLTDATSQQLFLDGWEKAMYRANGGSVQAIMVNEELMWGFARVLRAMGINGGPLFDVTKDMFDREIMTYKGAPFIDMGYQKDQATEIIPNDEIAGDSTANSTSAYFVSFNIEQGITGIQLDGMEVYDPLDGGERESRPTKLIRIDWWVGLAGFGSYGFSRYWNIEDPSGWGA